MILKPRCLRLEETRAGFLSNLKMKARTELVILEKRLTGFRHGTLESCSMTIRDTFPEDAMP
jgi:hypothetical protein